MPEKFTNGFLTYENKVEELKTYITHSISDTFQKHFKIRYIRIEDASSIKNTKSDFLKSKNFTITPDKMNLPGTSVMDVQFYYDESRRKLYLYYILDPDNIWGRTDLISDMYFYINKDLYDNMPYEEWCRLEIIGPAASVGNHICRISDNTKISPTTFSYWKLFDKRYYFLEDPTISVQDMHDHFLKTGDREIAGFTGDLITINNNYNFFSDPNDIPAGFDEYKTIYMSYLDKELKAIDDSKIVKMFLFNMTDYSIIDKYANRIQYIKH